MGRKNRRDNRHYTPLDLNLFTSTPPSDDDSRWDNYTRPPISDDQFGGSGYPDVAYGSDTSTGSH